MIEGNRDADTRFSGFVLPSAFVLRACLVPSGDRNDAGGLGQPCGRRRGRGRCRRRGVSRRDRAHAEHVPLQFQLAARSRQFAIQDGKRLARRVAGGVPSIEDALGNRLHPQLQVRFRRKLRQHDCPWGVAELKGHDLRAIQSNQRVRGVGMACHSSGGRSVSVVE